MIYDFCIIGGGIVGLATAMELLKRQPNASLVILEKEALLAKHQTGHNSGVIHAGIYYAPGSLKADLCKRGAEATKQFCREHGIKFEVCGKLLVASTALEVQRMEALYARSQLNGMKVERLDAEQLRAREPNIVGLGGLFLDATGIVDYRQVCETMAGVIRRNGGEICLEKTVTAIAEDSDKVTVSTHDGAWQARHLVVCAGLQSDRLATLAGIDIDHQIIPFRGEYFRLPASKNNIVNHLIYPIPDPELPFLGVHLTRMIDGSVTVGPNAVLGLGRENYKKFSVNWKDVAEYARFPGFWKTIWQNLGSGSVEMKNSLFKSGYLEQCRKYCPSLELDDLLPYEAGIRAQAVMRDGSLVHDFLFAQTPRMLHVCNAPSPAATSAIPIGEMIADRMFSPN
ncbi:L-2-hydroxyglutarate oxidase [Pseudomonas sp. WS 5059]|jgi:L-2-hydroxyglutarate oxidase|uniref:L-2-hydroxyglutarate oxidase n=1 Tax=unclassified Pseudomonas TaxID=196821 RepID=UPI0014737957|nr:MULTISPECIES: L-2-hydroxyglutarate oxidase [unclassified Pseudomonas]NMX65633.1 L-2-hydroxyglutarate oxidase [Pseudomonas sp. WS 5079]NMX71040.1 L-2-hydroxyglutarate oxidase [Pseudomonas sp. WS 5111]NMX89392.1 L-2-hydroxyglutarate oxidase [Pseudomonas sp. WS 5010]NMY05683.1 L-2-hydroxyglutarate oxidase [Pseudomonas sp. WS 5059]NMY27939.1 L-2-hydroxyglutarate oxidase [Pseudomonas sp. WS 5021]